MAFDHFTGVDPETGLFADFYQQTQDARVIQSIHDHESVKSVAGKTGVVNLVKSDVGLSNVDNTTDLSKPISTATQTALNLKANSTDIPPVPVQSVQGRTGNVVLTKTDINLGNVDNTADTAKPISTAQQTALNLKANISSLALVATSGSYADLLNKPTIPVLSVAGRIGDVVLTKSDVNLANVDNIADINKPISTATENALNAKANTSSLALVATTGSYNDLLNQPVIPVTSVAGKTGAVTLDRSDVGLTNVDDVSDANKPVSAATQTALNLKANTASLATVATSGSYNDLANKPTIPTIPVTSVAGKTGAVTLAKTDVGLNNVDNTTDAAKPVSTATATAISGVQSQITAITTSVNLPNGYLNLASDGKVPTSLLPAITTTETYVVASEAAMLALPAQRGDIAIRTDLSSTFILSGTDPTQLTDWTAFETPSSPISSVNGQTGTVVLSKSDIGLGNVSNTSDASKPISTATQTALDLKANTASLATVATSGSYNDLINKPVTGVSSVAAKTGAVTLVQGDVGLGNVDNTSDINKPVSSAGQTALNLKANISSLSTVATTGSYNDLINKPVTGVSSVNGYTGAVTLAKSDVGLTNVDNTSDANKPVSTATQGELTNIVSIVSSLVTGVSSVNGHAGIVSLVKGDISLGNVDNTSDVNKPVSTAQQAAITAVDTAAVHKTGSETVAGVKVFTSTPSVQNPSPTGISGINFVDDHSVTVANVGYNNNIASAGAALVINNTSTQTNPTIRFQKNGVDGLVLNSDLSLNVNGSIHNLSNASASTDAVNKSQLDLKADASSNTGDQTLTLVGNSLGINGVHGNNVALTKSSVILGNVDNTSDVNKPVSTAQQTALNLKVDIKNTPIIPQTYGAVGDGITDDTTAFQNALNAIASAGHGELYLPPTVSGKYLVGHLSFAGNYLNITAGRGVLLMLKSGTNASLLSTPDDGVQRNGLRISGFAIEGNAVNQTGSTPLFDIYGMNDLIMKDLYISNPRGAAIRIGNTATMACINPYLSNLIIRGDTTNSQGAGIDLESGSSDAHISNCDIGWFKNDGGILLSAHYGAFISDTDVWQCKFGYHLFASNRTRFSNCLSDLADYNGWFSQNSSDIQLLGCQARESSQISYNSWDGFEFEGGSVGAPATDIVLSGCRAMGTRQRYGINPAQYVTRLTAMDAMLNGNVTAPYNTGGTGNTFVNISTNTGDQTLSLTGATLGVSGTNGNSVTLNSSSVGLGNVDNTSDATKNAASVSLTNKTISGAANSIFAIPESAVLNLVSDLATKANTSSLGAGAFIGRLTYIMTAALTLPSGNNDRVVIWPPLLGSAFTVTLPSLASAASETYMFVNNSTLTQQIVPAAGGIIAGYAGNETVFKLGPRSQTCIVKDAVNNVWQVSVDTQVLSLAGSALSLTGAGFGSQVTNSVTLSKSSVGLGNVDNTSDATKNAAIATLTSKSISGFTNTVTNVAQSGITNLVSDLAAKASTASLATAPLSGSGLIGHQISGASTLTIPASTWTPLSFTSLTDYTFNGGFGTDASGFKGLVVGGRYQAWVGATWQAGTATRRILGISFHNTLLTGLQAWPLQSANTATTVTFYQQDFFEFTLSSDPTGFQRVSLWAFQDTVGNLNVTAVNFLLRQIG